MKRLLLMGLALLPVLAMAQGFQVNLHGQKQIGMGHTGTGTLQDGASVLFNPGALAMLSENYFQAGVSPLLFKSAFQSTGSNQQFNNVNEVATPFTVYAVWGPKQAPWKLGLGVYTPFGGLTNWGNDWEGKYALESLNLKAINFQPTFSFKLTEAVSLGVGAVYQYNSVDLVKGIPVSADAQAELKGSGYGWGFNAGAFIKASKKLTIGINYRSQIDAKIDKGDALFSSIPTSLKSKFPDGDLFAAKIPLPATASIGFGYYPCDKWTLAFDFNFVNWAVYKSLDFAYTLPVNGSLFTSDARNYQNAVDFRGGAEYKATKMLALRFGGGYASTAVKDGYVTPEAPDANRVYVTGGVGYKVAKHLDLDASFEFEHVMSRTQTNIQSGLSGTFNTNVFIPGISLAYHW